jgi:hypothetical protein
VIASKTKIKGQQFRVMVYAVRTNTIETANQEIALAELQAQNPQLKGQVKFQADMETEDTTSGQTAWAATN